MTSPSAITVTAPAKINLGLEIIGRRDDGYHEIMTVMAMIDLVDTLIVERSGKDGDVKIHGVIGIPADDNLIAKAIRAFMVATNIRSGYEVTVEKRIPSPGGLGGASSDAAATLRALNALHGLPIPDDRLDCLAATLGSDVPFFLGTPVALARGTGTELSSLPALSGWVVLVVPALQLVAKTPTLYRALQPGDFSDGTSVMRGAQAIASGDLPGPDMVVNAFTRALYGIEPSLPDIVRKMREAGAQDVALSGAGPAHYALCSTEQDAQTIAFRLQETLPSETFVTVAGMLTDLPPLEVQHQ